MSLLSCANKLTLSLAMYDPKLVVARTGSCYIHLNDCKVKYVRVANHAGHKEKPRTWQLRTDVSSSRKGANRVYNNIDRLISDLINLKRSK